MRDLLDDPLVVAGVGFMVIAGLCAIAFYVARSFRDYTDEDHQDADQMLANLKEMHLRGDITDEEFRVIQIASQPHADATINETNTFEVSKDGAKNSDTESNSSPDEPKQP